MELEQVTQRIIGCAFKVSNGLGCGFLEKVYERALVHELKKVGLRAESQYSIAVHYDGIVVGEFLADILVEKCVLVELKAVKSLENQHLAQCLNYLRATNLSLCLLMNFGNPRVEVKRVINNSQKNSTIQK